MAEETITSRIVQALRLTRHNESDLARLMNTTSSNVNQQLKKETNSIRLVAAASELTGVDIGWMVTGKGDMFRDADTGINIEQIKAIARKEAKMEWLKQAKKLFGGEEVNDT